MRKEGFFRMDNDSARALLARVPVVHLATTDPTGAPILRTVHGVVLDDWLAFHGAPVGEKTLAVGRAVVVGAEETVARIPSYFMDPERACPATTLYRSVQVHGSLETVDDPVFKAQVLQALMEKLQPEGGHVPIRADTAMYARAVEGIGVMRVSLAVLDGKAKLAQNRTPAERAALVGHLARRGEPGDREAIRAVVEANPGTPWPA